MTEQLAYGWIGGDGTFTFAPSVTGTGYSLVAVTLTGDEGRLVIGLPGVQDSAGEEAG